MATDHYTRLGIKIEEFYNFDEQGKKELVDKQFRGLTGSLFSKLYSIFLPDSAKKRLAQLKNARDILKDDRMRKYYDFSLKNGEKPNVDYESLKNHLDNPSVFNNLIEKQQKKLDSIKSRVINGKGLPTGMGARALDIEKTLEKLKKTRSVIEEINNKAQMEQIKEELKSKLDKINDLNFKLKETKDPIERNHIKGDIAKIANEHSKLLKELNDLNSKSEQPKKEVGQQTEVTNNPIKLKEPQKKDDLTVIKEQFEMGLKRDGINIEGMSHKEILEKLKDNFLLKSQYEMIKGFEGESAKQATPDIDKVNSTNSKSAPPKPPRTNTTYDIPIIPPLPGMQKLMDQHQASNMNGAKLNSQSQQTPPAKPPSPDELIKQKEGELAMMKRSVEGEKRPGTLALKSEAVESLKSELAKLKSTELELIKTKTHEIIKERKAVIQDSKEWDELTNKLKDVNTERSKLNIELDKLGYQSKPDVNNNVKPQGKFTQQISQEQQKSNDRTI